MKVAEESRVYRSPAMRTPPPARFLIKLLIAGLTVGIIPLGADMPREPSPSTRSWREAT